MVKTAMTHIPDSPEVNRICLRGLSHPYRIYDPERIKYPLRRVGERGSGEWERISWDEAAEEIAQNGLKSKKSMDLRQLRNMLSLVDMVSLRPIIPSISV